MFNSRSSGDKRLRVPLAAVALATALTSLPLSAALGQDVPTQELDQALHDSLPEAIKSSGRVVAAGSFDNPPALYADLSDATKAAGIAPDLSKALGELLGVEFVWQNTQWPGQLPGLDAGTFDVVWGQVSVSAQRERELYDMIPWSQDTLAYLVLAENKEGFSDWASACGKAIGVGLGSIFVNVLKEVSDKYCVAAGNPAIEVREFQGNEEPAVRSGQVDAIVDHFGVLDRQAQEIPDVYAAVKLPEDQSFEFYAGLGGLAFKKDNVALTNALAAGLKTLYENGTWEAILAKHDSVVTLPKPELVKVNALTDTPVGELAK